MNGFNVADLKSFLPELCLAVTVLVLVAGDILVRDPDKKRRSMTFVALAGVFIAGIMLFQVSGTHAIFSGQLAIDPLGTLLKIVFTMVTVVAILLSMLSDELPDKHMGEYYALLVSITFGLFLMVSANDFLMVYLAIEMVSIVSYAMVGYRMRDRRSSEAALKYVVYGGAASGLMLFGISLFYGMFGTTDLTVVNYAITGWATEYFAQTLTSSESTFPLTLMVSLVFIFAGVGYKIAVVPFHMWSPDVYEGAPTPFTGFLSVGPKAAGFAVLIRIMVNTFVPGSAGGDIVSRGYITDGGGLLIQSIDLPIPAMLGIIAAATMTLGNLAALGQANVKRLLAYSSIAHAGYMLMAFVVLSHNSLHAVLFYLVVYYFMNFGAFAVVQAVREKTGGEMLEDFRGLGAREPIMALFMTVFLLSLTGLPPLAGFVAKFYLFAPLVEHGGFWFIALAIVGVLNSAVSLFYYLKIVKAMYLAPSENTEPMGIPKVYTWLVFAMVLPTVVWGLYWGPVSGRVRQHLALYRSKPPSITSVAVSQEATAPEVDAADATR